MRISGDPAVAAKWQEANIPYDPVVQSNKRGFLTFAQRGTPNTRSTQVFVNLVDNARLDGMRFAPFGQIVTGMEVIDLLYGLTQESQYDPARIKRAETVLKELLSEHGHQFATVKTEVKDIPPASVQVNFNIKEGPTVKVGDIKFTGNQHLARSSCAAP